MCVSFMDGPAAACGMTLRRAPILLRVVEAPDGSFDALDQLEDTPRPGERVHVYRKLADGPSGFAYVRPGGCFALGIYRHVPDAPVDELRDTDAWRAWASTRSLDENGGL